VKAKEQPPVGHIGGRDFVGIVGVVGVGIVVGVVGVGIGIVGAIGVGIVVGVVGVVTPGVNLLFFLLIPSQLDTVLTTFWKIETIGVSLNVLKLKNVIS